MSVDALRERTVQSAQKATRWRLPAVLASLGLAAALLFARLFPAVEGLGTKVRLPIFHGALTWANLVLFAALALVALVAVITQRPGLYQWDRALRVTTVLLWLLGTVLGLAAAGISWDFSASQESPLRLLLQEPRLQLQFLTALAGVVVLAVPLVLSSVRVQALLDVLFGLGTLGGLYLAFNSGNGLHPDSPVMSSDEIMLKLIFFCLVAAQLLFSVASVALVKTLLSRRDAELT
jgi:hypothetical protein